MATDPTNSTVMAPEKTSQNQQLIERAKHNPYLLFTAKELSIILGKSKDFVMAAKQQGAPFPGNVSRPEWIMEWLKKNPKFTVKSV